LLRLLGCFVQQIRHYGRDWRVRKRQRASSDRSCVCGVAGHTPAKSETRIITIFFIGKIFSGKNSYKSEKELREAFKKCL
jgi:hypothetical protein